MYKCKKYLIAKVIFCISMDLLWYGPLCFKIPLYDIDFLELLEKSFEREGNLLYLLNISTCFL